MPASDTDASQTEMLRVLTPRHDTRRHHDRIAKTCDLILNRGEASLRQVGLGMLSVAPGEHVLEIGFGTGHCLVALAALVGPSGKVFGLDLADAMVALARETVARAGVGGRVALAGGDGAQLPFRSHSLDAVFMSLTLELFDTPQLPVILGECRRVLRPSGRIGVVSMSKTAGAAVVLELYEWAHRHLPTFVDCRPIYVARAREAARFQVTATDHGATWLPVEFVVARNII